MAKLTKENLLLTNIVCNLISFNKEPLFKTPCFVYDQSNSDTQFLIKGKKKIFESMIYNCFDKILADQSIFESQNINFLEGKLFRNMEGIVYDEDFIENSNLKNLNKIECEKKFKIPLNCNHSEHFYIEQNVNLKNDNEKNRFIQEFPYWLKAHFFPEENFKSIFEPFSYK